MITTHVLDITRGKPAAGVGVALAAKRADGWIDMASGRTDDRGRLTSLTEGKTIAPGTYRLTFDVAAYQRSQGTASFFPEVQVTFEISDASQHFHVPLLISPFGYSTYKGT